MSPDTSLGETSGTCGEPGIRRDWPDDIVMRAPTNLRRLADPRQAMAETPYDYEPRFQGTGGALNIRAPDTRVLNGLEFARTASIKISGVAERKSAELTFMHARCRSRMSPLPQ